MLERKPRHRRYYARIDTTRLDEFAQTLLHERAMPGVGRVRV
jgi:hypothetical protein